MDGHGAWRRHPTPGALPPARSDRVVCQLLRMLLIFSDFARTEAAGKENPACVLARGSDNHKMRRREWKDNTQERGLGANEANNKRGWEKSGVMDCSATDDYTYPNFTFRQYMIRVISSLSRKIKSYT